MPECLNVKVLIYLLNTIPFNSYESKIFRSQKILKIGQLFQYLSKFLIQKFPGHEKYQNLQTFSPDRNCKTDEKKTANEED